MSESKGPDMNGVRTIGEGSCRINNQPQTRTMCSTGEVKGEHEQNRGIHLPDFANLNTCSAEEGNLGAHEYGKFEPERQQELEIMFGQ
jgi:hypothetical protein